MGYCLNREKMFMVEILGMIVCFVCVVLISTSGGSGDMEEQSFSVYGILMSLLSSLVFAVNCINNRQLKEVYFALVTFYYGVFGLVMFVLMAIGIAFWSGNSLTFFSYEPKMYLLICLGVSCDTLACNMSTIAFQSGASGFISLISYVAIVYAFLSDLFIFHEDFTSL
jgi:drug/metabolite transporter (DMT)-like permease